MMADLHIKGRVFEQDGTLVRTSDSHSRYIPSLSYFADVLNLGVSLFILCC